MQNSQRKELVRKFVETWTGRGYEKGESQTFWLQLLHDVLGVEDPYSIISFESQVDLNHTSFMIQFSMSSYELGKLPQNNYRR